MAASTGTILVDDETRKIERNLALFETVLPERTVRMSELNMLNNTADPVNHSARYVLNAINNLAVNRSAQFGKLFHFTEVSVNRSSTRKSFRHVTVNRSTCNQLNYRIVKSVNRSESAVVSEIFRLEITAPTEPDGVEVKLRQNMSIRVVRECALCN